MSSSFGRVALAGLVVLAWLLPSGSQMATHQQPKATAHVADWGGLPLGFERNRGQTDPHVKFLTRAAGYTLFLTGEAAVLGLPSRECRPQPADGNPCKTSAAFFRMKPQGANPKARLTGLDDLPGKSNYFIGNDPAKWRTDISTYRRVEYRGVYPGIDLVYYGNRGQTESDWIVHPGADPRRIRILLEGAETARLEPSGDLLVKVGDGEVRLQKPEIYQMASGSRRPVSGSYRLYRAAGVDTAPVIGFEVGRYDPSRLLTIDPVLTFASLVGGSGKAGEAGGYDSGQAIAVDAAGNTYVAGVTFSTDFPTVNPIQPGAPSAQSIFVLKINSAGTALVYSTFLSSSGIGSSGKMGLAVDASGSAVVVAAGGTGFPVVNAAQPTAGGNGDAVVAKLAPTGSALVYSTFLGGSGQDSGAAVALDSTGNACVVGNTASLDFPATPGVFQTALKSADAFVVKLSPSGAIVYSTYLGGSGNDFGLAIAVDPSGNTYVVGGSVAQSATLDFPTTPGAFQPSPKTCSASFNSPVNSCQTGFVAKLNPAGSALIYATFLGGSTDPIGPLTSILNGVAVDPTGAAYVTGWTRSDDFPTTPSAFQTSRQGGTDAFVVKLNTSASALLYSTRIGGGFPQQAIGFPPTRGGGNAANAIALDSAGNAYITGDTSAKNFPLVRPIQATNNGYGISGRGEAFIVKLNPSASALVYSSYFGGEGAEHGNGIAVDSAGNAYVTGAWGSGSSGQFPAVGPLQPNVTAIGAFIIKITDTNNPIVAAAVTNGASFDGGLSPGAISTVFGTGITTVNGIVTATTLPLPKELAGTSLTVNGIPAPIFAVANVNGLEQINFQAPWELGQATIPGKVVVTKNGATSDPVYVYLVPRQWGIFLANPSTPAIQHAADYQLVTTSNPAKRGETIIIYATGLGPVQPNPGTGNPAPSSPPSVASCSGVDGQVVQVTVLPPGSTTLIRLEVQFVGLAPGFVGLYQLNVRIPDTVPSGTLQLALQPQCGSIFGNTVNLPVQ